MQPEGFIVQKEVENVLEESRYIIISWKGWSLYVHRIPLRI